MDQPSICLLLAMKRLSAQAMDNELVAVLGPEAIGSSTVTNYLRQRHFPSTLRKTPEESAATVINNAILAALEKRRFSPIREPSQLTCIPRSTVHRHIAQSLGFVVKHLRWVPHSLTAAQRAQRITVSNGLLRELRSIKHHEYQFIIMLDESWFSSVERLINSCSPSRNNNQSDAQFFCFGETWRSEMFRILIHHKGATSLATILSKKSQVFGKYFLIHTAALGV
jgi:hypothetical protein